MSHAAPRDAERRIDNIEFNVADIARSKRFYGEVFGWCFTDYGPAYTEFDDGRLKGGFVSDAPVRAQGGPLVILRGPCRRPAARDCRRWRGGAGGVRLPRWPSLPLPRSGWLRAGGLE